MDLSSLARSALRPAYTVARVPLQVADRALGAVVPRGEEPRATVTRVLGTADMVVGMVLEDQALVQRGSRLRESGDPSRRPDAWSSSASPAGAPPADPAPAVDLSEPGTEPEAGAVAPVPAAEPTPEPTPEPEPAPEPEVDLAEVAAAAQARADAAAAMAEVDVEPAAPGDEHHLVGHHVDPVTEAPPMDKAAFAEAQRAKADAEMAADEAAREARD